MQRKAKAETAALTAQLKQLLTKWKIPKGVNPRYPTISLPSATPATAPVEDNEQEEEGGEKEREGGQEKKQEKRKAEVLTPADDEIISIPELLFARSRLAAQDALKEGTERQRRQKFGKKRWKRH